MSDMANSHERDKVDGSQSSASSVAWQIQPGHKLLESIQPGNVKRLVDKFRRLGEPTFHNKPYSRRAPSKRLSVLLTEGHAQRKKEVSLSRKKSDRSKKTWMTEEKWILLTPSLVLHNEFDSCSVSLSQPTFPVVHHKKSTASSVCTKDKDGGLLPVLGCEHEESEIAVPIECIAIEEPAERHKRLTVGACKNYLLNDAADNEHIYEEIEKIKTCNHVDTENGSETRSMMMRNKTKVNAHGNWQKNLVVIKDDALSEDKPYKQHFCDNMSSLAIQRNTVKKERLYEEIDAETTSNHSDSGNKNDEGAATAVHPSNSAKAFVPDDGIYEEIDLDPPIILVREQNFLSSSSLRTLNTCDRKKRDDNSVTESQYENFCSKSSGSNCSNFRDSFISDLDEYDIIYKSELTGSEPSLANCDTLNCYLTNVRFKGNREKLCVSLQRSLSHSEISGKSSDNSCLVCELSSKATETSEFGKTSKESACGSDDEENIYETYEFAPAASVTLRAADVKCKNIPCKDASCKATQIQSKCVTCKGITADDAQSCETGCCECGLPRCIISESSSCRNSSFTSSSIYESFSSDDEYVESTPGYPDVQESLMQRAEEPCCDVSAEEAVSTLDRIVLEFLDTERKYIDRLKLINDEFRVAVTDWNQEKNHIPSDIIRQMFLNIDVIYKLHSGFFLPELEACRNKDMNRKVEDTFIKGADFLKMYAEYSCNFSTAMKLIEQWKSKVPEFNRFILDIQQNPICRSLTLEHHMLEPILRIPRYELLLNKYLENLPEDSLEREKTLKAVRKVNAAASHCNNFIMSMEKNRKVMGVQQSLWGKVDLMTPSRELIIDGRMKVSQQQQKDEDKQLFLFNDTLLVCKIFPLGITPPYKMTLQLDIDGMQVVDRRKEGTVETFFVTGTQGYLEMHPGSIEEKIKWTSALNAVIAKHMAVGKSRHNSTVSQNSSCPRHKCIPGTHAPIWIKDPQANRCMQCDEKFNAFKRRHHCRACGVVVCGKCSNKEAPLAYDNFTQQHRVCGKCFTEILSSTDDDSESKTKVSIEYWNSLIGQVRYGNWQFNLHQS